MSRQRAIADPQPSWPFSAVPADQDALFQLNSYPHHTAQIYHSSALTTHPAAYHQAWHASPSVSPTTPEFDALSLASSGSSSSYYSTTSRMDSGFHSSTHTTGRTSRASPYASPGLHFHAPYTPLAEPDFSIVHETSEIDTGEERIFKDFIHRFSDEEKRRLNVAPSHRPTFCCMLHGCGQWLLHRSQVRSHLADHGFKFKKPFRCSCGAEFGRQVEAARHVEDKKLCQKCNRAGRKHKGGVVCLRCLGSRDSSNSQ